MLEKQQKAEAEAQASAVAEAQAKAQAEEDARKRAQAEADTAAAEKAQAEAQLQQAQADAARAQRLWPSSRKPKRKPRDNARPPRMRSARRKNSGSVCLTSSTRCWRPRTLPAVSSSACPTCFLTAADIPSSRLPASGWRGYQASSSPIPTCVWRLKATPTASAAMRTTRPCRRSAPASVRDYLVDNGVSINNVIARGLGKGSPVADNSTAAGRKLNRRVEMIVSGDVIGTQITPGATTPPAAPPQ